MKKVMIGILILIPIIIVLIVAMVSMIVSTQAWIAVEDLQLVWKGTEDEAESVTYSLDEIMNIENQTISFSDLIDVVVLPAKANRYVIEWSLVGDINYEQESDKTAYEKYCQEYSALRAELEAVYPNFSDPDQQTAYQNATYKYGSVTDSSKIISAMANELVNERVWPAVMLVDDYGDEVSSNTSGDARISAFSHFTVQVSAENVSKTLLVTVGGEDVQIVTISSKQSDGDTISVGESKRLVASYTPADCIVNHTIWTANNTDIATIDQNGVITAHKAGTASFTLQASKRSSEKAGNIQYVASNTYTVTVTADGLSAKYGKNAMLSANRAYTLTDLGIDKSEDSVEIVGATVVNGVLTVNSGATLVTITDKTTNETFTINVCQDNSIRIANADIYAYVDGVANQYVLGVDDISLKLSAIWADVMRTDALTGVVWTSSDTSIATVDNGVVKGISKGVVTITASKDGVETSVRLNVQNKIAKLQLRTSDESLAVGLAKETVFASERYENVDTGARVPNSVDISVAGEPKRTSDMSDAQYASALEEFYTAYNFDIIEGSEFATLSGNKLTFIPQNIVADNRQGVTGDVVVKRVIKVQVSAKYPKNEGDVRSTTKTVSINVVHGVAVYNVKEFKKASEYQKEYAGANVFSGVDKHSLSAVEERAKTNSNLVLPTKVFSHENAEDKQVYEVWSDPRSIRTYSICVMANCPFDTEKKSDGTPAHVLEKEERFVLYGNVYGNNKMVSALTGQIKHDVIYIAWSDVTVSNLIVRANENPENGEIKDADDTKAFAGNGIKVGGDIDWDYFRITNIGLEYAIVENAETGVYCYNSDFNVKSCIFRNFPMCAMSSNQCMEEDNYGIIHPVYSHVSFHNIIASNTLGSLFLGYYKNFVYTAKNTGRFIKGNTDANNQYYLDNFASQGVNLEITQTGIFDIYNWQNVNNASMFSTGMAIDQYIQTEASPILRDDPAFNDFRYQMGDDYYIHYAFVIVAIDKSLSVEPTFMKMDIETDELIYVNSSQVTMSGIGAGLLRTLDAKIYSYKNTAHILPYSTYQINKALIDRMHS